MNKQAMVFDPEWLETMYNNRINVKDSEKIIADWISQSSTFRSVLTSKNRAKTGIRYGDGETDLLDIFLPETHNCEKGWPVLVFIHGGYWYALGRSDLSFIADTFVKQGICVVVIDYALCPSVTVPEIVQQTERAVSWIHKNIENYGGNSDKITISGHSAGGHLSAMMLAADWAKHGYPEGQMPFRNVFTISGLFDLKPLQYTPFLKMLALDDEQVRRASPVLYPAPAAGQMICTVGKEESSEFLRQNRLLKDLWGDTVDVTVLEINNKDHFTIVSDLADENSEISMHLKKFLTRFNEP